MSDHDPALDDAEKWREMGGRLRESREYMGFSQADVAEVLGVSRPAVSAIEAGRRRVTGLELKVLANLFQRSYAYFVGDNVEVEADETMSAIYRASRNLSEHDKQELRQFAEYLRSRGSTSKNGRS